MSTPAIIPTITQRVRSFLAEQGADLRPWSGLQETYDELYGLLRRRQKDPEFWQPLKGLLKEVVASAADSQKRGPVTTAPGELLGSWQVDELVDDLRNALPEDAVSARSDFTRTLSAAVLGGFLLLGLAAAGCGNGDSEAIPGGTGGTLGTGGSVTMVTGTGGVLGSGGSGAGGSVVIGTGGAVGSGGAAGGAGGTAAGGAGGRTTSNPVDGGADLALDSADAASLDDGARDGTEGEAKGIDTATPPFCTQIVVGELDRAIGQSSLSANQKSQLCACFSALGTEWTTSLTQLFATATPEEISKMLSGLTSCCLSDGIHGKSGVIASPSASDLSTIKNGMSFYFCAVAVPVYKGVSFPES